MADVRSETDSLGAIDVPANRYWGAQTQRSRENFPIGDPDRGERMPIALIHAFAVQKQAAARANKQLGVLDPKLADAIAAAAASIATGAHDNEFPLVVWQTGSGTQTNMNLNEVIAALANEGFYDGVNEVDPKVMKQWDELGFDDAAFLGMIGLKHGHGESGRSTLERTWSRPTCDANGIIGGYTGEGAKTVIASHARTKLSCRLVAGQDPERVRESIETYDTSSTKVTRTPRWAPASSSAASTASEEAPPSSRYSCMKMRSPDARYFDASSSISKTRWWGFAHL